ncbi:unknown protein [Oryza sativa Japonica Group]|uniref:cDNA clone:J023035J19, full insert sequence n=1 Tax=Oryza sativa subsp. japonica TaxID=39947 RepID=Q5NAH7_ORYSJ|nr:uncharacterized protein LOC4327832 [Oryza sativa Japonica Group]BAD81526.1 unknown protein [Oryza sativa Japonica Group]BAG91706.1 unnamed protein product [Oryza sativa Japonica Group]
MSSSGRGGKRQGAPPPAPFGAAAKRAQPHGGHLADDSIRASGDLSSPIGSAPNGRCLLFHSSLPHYDQQRRKLIQFPSASGPWSLISYQFARVLDFPSFDTGQSSLL